MLKWFFLFPEFAEFTEFPFHLGKTHHSASPSIMRLLDVSMWSFTITCHFRHNCTLYQEMSLIHCYCSIQCWIDTLLHWSCDCWMKCCPINVIHVVYSYQSWMKGLMGLTCFLQGYFHSRKFAIKTNPRIHSINTFTSCNWRIVIMETKKV